MSISKVYGSNNDVTYITTQNKVKDRIYNVGKNAFHYLVKNKYALTLSFWSYFLIESGVTATQAIFGETFVYNVDTCREVLCAYSSNYTNYTNAYGTHIPNYEITCNPSIAKIPHYTFLDCLDDLCRYTSSIGENFYACLGSFIERSIISEPYLNSTHLTFQLWNRVCPKRHFSHISSLNQLSYLNKCIKKMCKINETIPIEGFDKEMLTLCKENPLDNLHFILHEIKKSVNTLKESIESTDSLTRTSIITGIASSLTSIVAGVATAAGLITAHRATQETMEGMVPSLADGLRTIARSTAQATLAIVSGSASQVEEFIAEESIDILNQLGTFLRESIESMESLPIEIIETTV